MRAAEKEQAVAEALQKWEGSFYRLALSYVHHPEDAMDIAQESAYKAIRSSGKFREEPAALKAWIFRIVVNTSLDWIRKNRRITVMEEIPEQGKVDSYERMELLNLLQTLDEKTRTVIILKYFEDLKLEEVAKVLGENLNTVKSRLYRGLKQLRIELDRSQKQEGGAHAG